MALHLFRRGCLGLRRARSARPREQFPTVDFAARHFRDPEWQAIPPEPLGIGEAKALLNVGSALRIRDGVTGRLPDSIMLSAGDRLRQAIAVDPTAAGHWTMLGMSCWNMVGDLTRPAPRARASLGTLPGACSRHRPPFASAVPLSWTPRTTSRSSSLLRSLETRGMTDARTIGA